MTIASLGSKEICKRYAQALLELSLDQNQLMQMVQEATEFLEISQNSAEMQDLISSPLYSAEEQKKALKIALDHLKYSEIMKGFVDSLCENRRIFLLTLTLEAFLLLAEKAMGIKPVSVYSSKPLSESQKEKLTQKLENELGCQIRLDLHVKPSVKGGIRIEVDSLMVDNTIQTKLKSYHQAIKGTVS